MRLVLSDRNQSTELRMVDLMREHRIAGWRRGQKLTGKPDFVFRHKRVAVFVDGCFWHGCPKHLRKPNSRQDYWNVKLARNQARDKVVNRSLRKAGWTVIRVWECDLARKHWPGVARRLARALGRASRLGGKGA